MKNASGFSLVEVLVSIVILAVALLGTAGLMGTSLRSTNNSYYRSQATFLADDILDRMRANRADALLQSYDIDPGPAYHATGGMALYDCQEWTAMLQQSLPGGTGTVDVLPSGVITVVIEWGDDDADSFTTSSVL